MKRTLHNKPPKRHSHSASSFTTQDSRILSHEEKHELIRAHAQAREKRPNGYSLGYYIAVAASCLVVVTGWVMTLDHGLWQPTREPDKAFVEFTQNAKKMQEEIDQSAQKIDSVRKQLKAATATSTK